MKAQVIIENGKTSINLTPEFEFEKTIIEKFKDEGNINFSSSFSYKRLFGESPKDHKISIDITKAIQ